MRVLCSTLEGRELEEEMIGGNFGAETSGEFDLAEHPDGPKRMHGWLVDVKVLEKTKEVM